MTTASQTKRHPDAPADALVARELARIAPLLIDPLFDAPGMPEAAATTSIRRIGRLMGLADIDAEIKRSPLHRDPVASVEFTGASPSLHRSKMALRRAYPSAFPIFDACLHMLHMTSLAFAVQCARRIDAQRLHLDAPLDPDADRCDHLMVDASLVLMAKDRRQDAATLFRRGLVDLHNCASQGYDPTHHHGPVHRHGSNHVAEGPRAHVDAVAPRTYGIHAEFVRTKPVRTTTGVFDGRVLQMFDVSAPPETVLSALSGRPLCDLVRVDPRLDDRIIATARVPEGGETDRLFVTFEPDLVPFPETRP